MGNLIDDMLSLSRVTRSEMRFETVDLSALAHTIVVDLQQREPERDVEVKIQDGIVARADGRLLQIALDNLLSNAWKFTSKKPKAHISFTVREEAGERVFGVTDDGAGFSMEYVDKLFGAFQRLHRTNDFPGTGIGLATVQRVIERHGGRTWAEGEVGKGARFNFTLGDAQRTTT
jgi:light-regulated signal transduction histidine kinase (bacteriophytochrome)